MDRYLSPRYVQVILVSGYPVLTTVNINQKMDVQYQVAPGLLNYYLYQRGNFIYPMML